MLSTKKSKKATIFLRKFFNGYFISFDISEDWSLTAVILSHAIVSHKNIIIKTIFSHGKVRKNHKKKS